MTNILFHNENNIFPVGFKSIRVYHSMFNINNKVDYLCEIIDGGNKPIFKVTSSEDISNPIIKDSPNECWYIIENAINELKGNKKTKINIDGIERFGLSESFVKRLISNLSYEEKAKSNPAYNDN